jgi:hypothetical protein
MIFSEWLNKGFFFLRLDHEKKSKISNVTNQRLENKNQGIESSNSPMNPFEPMSETMHLVMPMR